MNMKTKNKRNRIIDGLERIRKCDREVMPLHLRESPLNTRKGMTQHKTKDKDAIQAVLGL